VTFTNRSRGACELRGWPSIAVEAPGRPAWSAFARRVVQSSKRPARVRLEPGGAASFDVFGADWDAAANRPCPEASTLSVELPGDHMVLRIAVRIPDCGLFEIAPLVPGRRDRDAWSLVVRAGSPGSTQPVLRRGSRGALVAAWQQVLNFSLSGTSGRTARLWRRLGSHIAVDGVFGPRTAAATGLWETGASLRGTGAVTLRTWIRWIGANVTCCGAGLPDFRVGLLPARPDAYVGWWQVALGRWLSKQGVTPIAVDGLYGDRTRAATAFFQRTVGLPATGVADRATWTRMQHQDDSLSLP
jgi:peptidoglycan hydrolase-like protein with peptidoglycan-binding domain